MPFDMGENMLCFSAGLTANRTQTFLLQKFFRFFPGKMPLGVRKFPHSGKKTLVLPAVQSKFSVAKKHEYRKLLYFACFFCAFYGVKSRLIIPVCAADGVQRTGGAFRLAVRNTDDFAKLHNSLRQVGGGFSARIDAS